MITRRAFLGGVAATVATARRASAEPPPETSRLRLLKTSSICWAPQYVAEDLLHAEGFSDVTYVDMPPTEAISVRLAAGEADLGMNFVGPNLVRVDAGDPVVFLAGVHVGCFEAFASDRIQRIHDLKGKTVVVEALNSANHLFFATIAAHVGLDPRRDIRWVSADDRVSRRRPDGAPYSSEAMQLFMEGKADAFLGFPLLQRAEEGAEGMNRRQFVRGAAITSAAAASGVASLQAAAEPPPETTKIRLVRTPSLCVAPMHLSEPLLMAEGFTDVQYQKVTR